MPTLGICTVEAGGQPLPIALFVRQSFGSLDVLINEGLVWLSIAIKNEPYSQGGSVRIAALVVRRQLK
jgi:hypothetical protein